MTVFILLLLVTVSPINSVYQSYMTLSSTGMEFKPENTIQLISETATETQTFCCMACNQLQSCRIFDYDLVSRRCRLFEGDSNTGSIISSASPTSIVGTVRISGSIYSSTHEQPCQVCQQSRYEICSTNTSTCQCPIHTYWNGTVCALQLFENDTCSQSNSCRQDLNLSCTTDCYGDNPKCLQLFSDNTTFPSVMPFGVTVAGGCNGSSSTNQTVLNWPADIILVNNNSLYVADYSNQLLLFALNNRTGRAIRSFANWPTFLFFDNRSSSIYITVLYLNLVYIWPSNTTIPPSGILPTSCSMNTLYNPTVIIVDSVGNVYIASIYCHWVTRWAPNATSGTLVAGSPSGEAGNDSSSLYAPYGLALDEPNSIIYVAERFNHRVQKFVLGGSGIGVIVAGGNNAGPAANQLSFPTEIYLSRLDGSLYIVDSGNNRVVKWTANATSGITIAGSPNGIAGSTPYLMDLAYAMAIDDEENYLYVTDSNNSRIQRFSLR